MLDKSAQIKDRFAHHFYDIQNNDQSKALGRHFSRRDHNGIKDMEISVVDFIKKPPRNPEASIIRDRVKKIWIHFLRCLAPMGLNIFD
jgi:transposase-like protein